MPQPPPMKSLAGFRSKHERAEQKAREALARAESERLAAESAARKIDGLLRKRDLIDRDLAEVRGVLTAGESEGVQALVDEIAGMIPAREDPTAILRVDRGVQRLAEFESWMLVHRTALKRLTAEREAVDAEIKELEAKHR